MRRRTPARCLRSSGRPGWRIGGWLALGSQEVCAERGSLRRLRVHPRASHVLRGAGKETYSPRGTSNAPDGKPICSRFPAFLTQRNSPKLASRAPKRSSFGRNSCKDARRHAPQVHTAASCARPRTGPACEDLASLAPRLTQALKPPGGDGPISPPEQQRTAKNLLAQVTPQHRRQHLRQLLHAHARHRADR